MSIIQESPPEIIRRHDLHRITVSMLATSAVITYGYYGVFQERGLIAVGSKLEDSFNGFSFSEGEVIRLGEYDCKVVELAPDYIRIEVLGYRPL